MTSPSINFSLAPITNSIQRKITSYVWVIFSFFIFFFHLFFFFFTFWQLSKLCVHDCPPNNGSGRWSAFYHRQPTKCGFQKKKKKSRKKKLSFGGSTACLRHRGWENVRAKAVLGSCSQSVSLWSGFDSNGRTRSPLSQTWTLDWAPYPKVLNFSKESDRQIGFPCSVVTCPCRRRRPVTTRTCWAPMSTPV